MRNLLNSGSGTVVGIDDYRGRLALLSHARLTFPRKTRDGGSADNLFFIDGGLNFKQESENLDGEGHPTQGLPVSGCWTSEVTGRDADTLG